MRDSSLMSRRSFMTATLACAGAPAMLGFSSARAAGRRRQGDAPTVTVKTKSGDVRGMVMNGLNVFRGIPYASPPVGDLRFKAAVPPTPWATPRDAFRYGASPVQGSAKNISPSVSEDCLFLNVSAPTTPGPHPVFFWVYGGGNTGGSANSPVEMDSTFAHNDIVVVNVNYRLGAFGFLDISSVIGPEYAGSANNGILDLALALKWVRDNIAAFGGDPARVTIGGESAGGKNVCALLGLPAAQGLFRSAIVESGSGQTVHSADDAADFADLLLEGLALDRADAKKLLTASTKDVLAAQEHIQAKSAHNFPFRPEVDGIILPKRPVDSVASGLSRNVALLIGTNHDESRTFLSDAELAAPISARQVSNVSLKSVEAVAAGYDKAFPDLSPMDRRIQLITAEEYWMPCVRVAEGHASSGGKTWMYRFDYPAASGHNKGYAVHGSELAFVWTRPQPASDKPTARQALLKTMQDAWISFIKDQKPVAGGAADWPEFDPKARMTMIFDKTPRVEADPAGVQRRLWDGVI